MRGSWFRLLVESLLIATVLLSANLAAFGQEEKYYRSDTGLELSMWANGDSEVSLNLETRTGYVHAELTLGDGDDAALPVTWSFYDDKGTERSAGKGTVTVTDEAVVISISEGRASGQRFHDNTDPSGLYRRLSEADRLRFAKADFAQADAELNRVYGELRSSLQNQAELWSDLRQRQRDWLEYRDYIVEHPATTGGGPGHKEESVSYWDGMSGLTESQIEFLKIFTGESVPDGRDGVYIDARGGHLIVEKSDAEGLEFFVNVVRGPTFHLGELSGTSRIGADGTAVFVDTDPDAFIDGKPCIIRLKFDGKRVKLTGENTMAYHGARAYFDGEYFKSSAIPAQ